uniref:Putative secreted protein n=1 Tax=Anopheles marajoara TaxID=58244 RepID=A0A2M4C7Z8_9DIPT
MGEELPSMAVVVVVVVVAAVVAQCGGPSEGLGSFESNILPRGVGGIAYTSHRYDNSNRQLCRASNSNEAIFFIFANSLRLAPRSSTQQPLGLCGFSIHISVFEEPRSSQNVCMRKRSQ